MPDSLGYTPPVKIPAPSAPASPVAPVAPPVVGGPQEPIIVAPVPGQAPPVAPAGVTQPPDAERVAREAAEKRARDAEQSYQNLRTLVDRQGTSLQKIERFLTANASSGQNVQNSGDGSGSPAPPPQPGPTSAFEPESEEVRNLRFEMATTRFFGRDAEASKRQDEIVRILRDQNQVSEYVAYTPIEHPDGSVTFRVDFEKSIGNVWNKMQLTDLRAARATPTTTPMVGTQSQSVPVGSGAAAPTEDAQGAMQVLTDKLQRQEISPEEYLREAYKLGAIEINEQDRPAALGNPLSPLSRGAQTR